MKPLVIYVAMATACALCGATSVVAADSLYRWVDRNGEVHYSQTAPLETPATETRIKIQKSSAPAKPQAERDDNGNCLTIGCLADQMEADRLAREREYARQIAEHQRAARRETTEPAATNPLDDHLRENCRNGLFYGPSSKVDCDDIAGLRKQWDDYQRNIQTGLKVRKSHRTHHH